ncbi:hypothetical protein G4B88_030274 [Cannabis sativa]|uniref:Uncharacterized protein n=1 Tax=Cannabis sativa TaxID=3483 RepID=A0A7J6GEW8_CANSA|nr:hypothetical protein G4B88_030274 [Cannabis sativa]
MLDGIKKEIVPDHSKLSKIFTNLGIRDSSSCREEIESLQEEVQNQNDDKSKSELVALIGIVLLLLLLLQTPRPRTSSNFWDGPKLSRGPYLGITTVCSLLERVGTHSFHENIMLQCIDGFKHLFASLLRCFDLDLYNQSRGLDDPAVLAGETVLPMYGELKLALLIYLWYPKTMGSDGIWPFSTGNVVI